MKLREILRVVDPFQLVSVYGGGADKPLIVDERTPMMARQICADNEIMDCEVMHVYTAPTKDIVFITIIRE